MPYITEPALLKQLVPPPSLYTTVMNAVSIAQSTPSAPISMVTSCPWRSTGTKYAHNEIFFDINEELDCIMDQFGNLISGGIFGQIECISKLSGMPHLLLTLGNRKLLPQGSIGFHHCVEIDKFDSNGTISFIPPDGQFVLLDYSLDLMPQQIPLIVKPTLSKTLTGIKIDVSITPRISHDKTFESLTIKAHLPNASSVSFSSSFGVCSFDQISQTFMWDLNGYNTKEITKRPSVTITVNGVSSTGSIYDFHTDFRINMSNLTGIRIDALSVHAESYKPFKGGRSMVKTGRFQTRFRF
ncbi:Mu homology domain-containing protein [Globomyces pollinis-pini]|nr:Mu homology domain-containing protein [Globomyces pollinis-pini]